MIITCVTSLLVKRTWSNTVKLTNQYQSSLWIKFLQRTASVVVTKTTTPFEFFYYFFGVKNRDFTPKKVVKKLVDCEENLQRDLQGKQDLSYVLVMISNFIFSEDERGDVIIKTANRLS